MGLSIDPEVRGRIFAFADENLSSPAILKRLKSKTSRFLKELSGVCCKIADRLRKPEEMHRNSCESKGLTFGELRPMLQMSRTWWIRMIRCPKMRLDDV